MMNDDMIGPGAAQGAAAIPDMIITKLSVVAFCVRVAGVVALLFACWYFALHPREGTAKNLFENRLLWVFALLLTPTLLWGQWVILRQLIFHQRRAVWIERGQLKFLNDAGFGGLVKSLDVADILELSIAPVWLGNSPWGFPSVAVKMKGGWYGGYIMTLFFKDSAEIVRARLSDALFDKSP